MGATWKARQSIPAAPPVPSSDQDRSATKRPSQDCRAQEMTRSNNGPMQKFQVCGQVISSGGWEFAVSWIANGAQGLIFSIRSNARRQWPDL